MFRHAWPEIDVDIRAGLAFEALPALNREDVDLVISSDREPPPGIVFNPLFDYHPLGGLVILADLLGSFGYEQGVDVQDLLQRAGSLGELVDLILTGGVVETVESSLQMYDPRSEGLRDLLTLLRGGLN